MFKSQILGMYISLVQMCFKKRNTKRRRSKVIQTVTGWLFSSKNFWQNDISLKNIMYAFFSKWHRCFETCFNFWWIFDLQLAAKPTAVKKVKTTLKIYMVLTPYCKISEKCYFNYHLFELLITLEADISDGGFQNTSGWSAKTRN